MKAYQAKKINQMFNFISIDSSGNAWIKKTVSSAEYLISLVESSKEESSSVSRTNSSSGPHSALQKTKVTV